MCCSWLCNVCSKCMEPLSIDSPVETDVVRRFATSAWAGTRTRDLPHGNCTLYSISHRGSHNTHYDQYIKLEIYIYKTNHPTSFELAFVQKKITDSNFPAPTKLLHSKTAQHIHLPYSIHNHFPMTHILYSPFKPLKALSNMFKKL